MREGDSARRGTALASRRGADEGLEDAAVAGADLVFGMPLHAKAEAAARVLDALDDAVFGNRVDELPASYERYLANSLRRDLSIGPVPLRLNLRSSKNPFAAKAE